MKKKGKKKNKQIVNIFICNIDNEPLPTFRNEEEVEIKESDHIKECKICNKIKDIVFVIIALLFPFLVNRIYKVKDDLYIHSLGALISGSLIFTGMLCWFLGVGSVVALFIHWKEIESIIVAIAVILGLFLISSILYLSGESFSHETDSSKIYNFSSCIIAIIGCILTLVSILEINR